MTTKQLLLFILVFSSRSLLAQSPLDPTFGIGGISQFPDFYANHGVAVGLQSDGKILCYYTSSVSCFGHYIFRLLPNGAMDTTFDAPSLSYQTTPVKVKGVFYMSGSGLPDPGQTFIRQTSSGDIIVGISGYTIFRLKSNGVVDASFGNYPGLPGFTSLNSSGSTPALNAFLDFYEDPAGAYYYAASTINHDSILIAKTLTNGVMDNSYGVNGVKAIALNAAAFSGPAMVSGASFTSTGNLFVYGSSYMSGFNSFLAKLDMNGNLQTSFGASGVVLNNLSNDEGFTALTQTVNGDLFVSGYSTSPNDMYTIKLNSSGVIDNTFGTSGKKSYPYPTSATNTPTITSIPFDYNSPMYVTTSYSPSFMYWNQTYHSITNTGFNNSLFGTSGTWNPGVNYRIDRMISQPDGKIICLGSDSTHARILRYVSNKPNGIESIAKESFKIWQSGHAIFITNDQNLNLNSYQLFSIDGKLLTSINTNNITKTGDTYSIHIPDTLPSGLYIFSAIHEHGVQNLKIHL